MKTKSITKIKIFSILVFMGMIFDNHSFRKINKNSML